MFRLFYMIYVEMLMWDVVFWRESQRVTTKWVAELSFTLSLMPGVKWVFVCLIYHGCNQFNKTFQISLVKFWIIKEFEQVFSEAQDPKRFVFRIPQMTVFVAYN